MFTEHIRFSDAYRNDIEHKQRINDLYRKGLEMVSGGTLYGYKINPNNPKEVIAALFLLAEDYNRFHETL